MNRRHQFLGGRGDGLNTGCGLGRCRRGFGRLPHDIRDRLRDLAQLDVDVLLHSFTALTFQDLFGDVSRKLDHLVRAPGGIENRIIGCLNPDFLALLAYPFELVGLVFPLCELVPEFTIGFAFAIALLNKHAVMLAGDLVEAIAQRVQEIVIRLQDRAVHLELDDGLGSAEGFQLCPKFQIIKPFRGIGPLDDGSDTLAALPEMICDQIERPLPDLDGRAVGGCEAVQQASLVRRILVKDVDRLSQELVGTEVREHLTDVVFGFLQKPQNRLIHISDVVVCIRYHHIRGQLIRSQ